MVNPLFFLNLVFTLVCIGRPTPARNPKIIDIFFIPFYISCSRFYCMLYLFITQIPLLKCGDNYMIMLNHNLRIFIRVAEKGSITETANELYISQPAVSKAIKILEDELNLKLFHRDKRKGLILTDIGHEILILARQMEKTENRMYQAAFRSNNFIGGKVRIASMPILTSVILSEVFYRFHKLYPYVSIELIEGSSMDIRKAIEEHQVDLGIFSAPFDTLDYQLLFTDRMIAVGTSEMLTDPVLDLNIEPERFIFCQAGHETAMELLKAKNVKISQSFIV